MRLCMRVSARLERACLGACICMSRLIVARKRRCAATMAREDPTQDAVPLREVAHVWCRCRCRGSAACRCRRTNADLADERVYNALLRRVDALAQDGVADGPPPGPAS